VKRIGIQPWPWASAGMAVSPMTTPNAVTSRRAQRARRVVIDCSLVLGEYREGTPRYTEAQTWLNKIRFRAGMPAITETGAALKERYRNERRIELAYEDQRYHDCRRWMIAPATFGRKLVYIDVVGKLKPGATSQSPYKHDETKYNYIYTPLEVNSQEDRKWDDKMYFRPIPQDEMNTNLKLIQNPGYN